MEGLIFDIKHCAIHDGPGLRTTVFFKSCPLNCWWCHNPESISREVHSVQSIKKVGAKSFKETKVIGYKTTVAEVMKEIEKDIVFFDESKGGVTFSGGEPLMQPAFLSELAQTCKLMGIHTALDTSGYAATKTVLSILPHIDLFLFDIKVLEEAKHKKYTGVSNTLILKNLGIILEHKKHVIIRYPLIPGINNTEEQLSALREYLSSSVNEIHFLPYHTIAKNKYKQIGMDYKMGDAEMFSDNYLDNLKTKFEQDGFKIKIGG